MGAKIPYYLQVINDSVLFTYHDESGKRYRNPLKVSVSIKSKFKPEKINNWLSGEENAGAKNGILKHKYAEREKWISDFTNRHQRRPTAAEFKDQFSGKSDKDVIVKYYTRFIAEEKKGRKENTIESHVNFCGRLKELGEAGIKINLFDFNSASFNELINYWENEGYGPNTIKLFVTHLSGFFKYTNARKLSDINRDVLSYSGKAVDKIYLLQDEFDVVYNFEYAGYLKDHATLSIIQALTGCRDIDLSEAKWIEKDGGLTYVPVKQGGAESNAKPGIILITERLRKVIQPYYRDGRYVFPRILYETRLHSIYTLLNLAGIEREITLLNGIGKYKAGQKVDIKDCFGTHNWRKTFAHIQYTNGIEPYLIADSMGLSLTMLLKNYLSINNQTILNSQRKAEQTRLTFQLNKTA